MPDDPTGAVADYLREIGPQALLGAARAAELAKQRDQAPTAAERDAATTLLVEGNLKWVVAIAKRYLGHGVPLEDLIQEGNIGLLKAAAKFDPSLAQFSTYSYWWIKQQILRALPEQGRSIPLPVHYAERLQQFAKAAARLEQELGGPPDDAQLAEALAVDEGEVARLRASLAAPISLNARHGPDDTPLEELLEAPPPSEDGRLADGDELRSLMRTAGLTPREMQILRLRFGLWGDGCERTLQEVGAQFGITRERVRQLELAAMAKLRGVEARLLGREGWTA